MELLYRITSAHREAALTSASGLNGAGVHLWIMIVAVTAITIMTFVSLFVFLRLRARGRSALWLGRPLETEGKQTSDRTELPRAVRKLPEVSRPINLREMDRLVRLWR